jgi:hypothetical protein
MSAQATAIAYALTQQRRISGVEITYTRAGGAAATFRAIKGKYDALAQSGELVLGQAEVTDWIFPLSELAGEPTDNDTLVCDGNQFDLVPVAGGRAWKYLTPDRTWIRVHTVMSGPAP